MSLEELEVMADEMSNKFARLSDVLVSELQQRDVLVLEMETRNHFISTMLKVQNMRHTHRVDGSMDGVRNRSRTWALKPKEEKYSGKV